MELLSAAGVPLWGERGRSGGFQLRPGWRGQLAGMTQPEAGALLLAVLQGPATELGLGGAAASARLKLVASLLAEWREQVARVGERLHVDALDWYRAPDTLHGLRELAHAVWSSCRVTVDDESWRGALRRVAARESGLKEILTDRMASITTWVAKGRSFAGRRALCLRPGGFLACRRPAGPSVLEDLVG